MTDTKKTTTTQADQVVRDLEAGVGSSNITTNTNTESLQKVELHCTPGKRWRAGEQLDAGVCRFLAARLLERSTDTRKDQWTAYVFVSGQRVAQALGIQLLAHGNGTFWPAGFGSSDKDIGVTNATHDRRVRITPGPFRLRGLNGVSGDLFIVLHIDKPNVILEALAPCMGVNGARVIIANVVVDASDAVHPTTSTATAIPTPTTDDDDPMDLEEPTVASVTAGMSTARIEGHDTRLS